MITAFDASQLAVAGAHAADTASSIGLHELNPLLGRGPFGPRQTTIKGALVGAGLLAQRKAPKRWRRTLTMVNWATTAAMAGVAVRNWRIR